MMCINLVLGLTAALIKIVNDLKTNSAANKLSILVLLEQSAAFDTVNHDILLSRLNKSVGLSGRVIYWLPSCLTGRTFTVAQFTPGINICLR